VAANSVHSARAARRLHHRLHIVHALIERRQLANRHRIRQARAALVEQYQSGHRRQTVQERRK
jgi:hypothetical protein